MLDLTGRHVLVTGGSRGIGAATARLCARLGARVALSYRADGDAARATREAIEASGGWACEVQADLSLDGAAPRLVAEASARLGGLDGVVVNHGVWKPAPIAQMTDSQWAETIAVNLTGAAAVCRAACGHLEAGAAIVIVASTAGQRGEAGYAHYAASKGGLIALTKSLGAELAARGVRVNGVAPGWVLTDMTHAALSGQGGERALERNPLGRAGSVEEIAGPIAFLLSSAASYMYGEVFAVNGGAVLV